MKALVIINKIALFTTLILYIIVFFGLIAQIVLGFIQVTSALILTYKNYNQSEYAKKHLSNYWIASIGELLLIYLLLVHFRDAYDIILYLIIFIFPIAIAIYFYVIMIRISQEKQDN